MSPPRLFADFHNADSDGRLRLNCFGTIQDLSEQKLVLQEGLCVMLCSESLQAPAVVQFSPEERIWVASIDWNAIQESPSAD